MKNETKDLSFVDRKLMEKSLAENKTFDNSAVQREWDFNSFVHLSNYMQKASVAKPLTQKFAAFLGVAEQELCTAIMAEHRPSNNKSDCIVNFYII